MNLRHGIELIRNGEKTAFASKECYDQLIVSTFVTTIFTSHMPRSRKTMELLTLIPIPFFGFLFDKGQLKTQF